MAVKIRIKGNQETPEYEDAIVLKEIFEKELKRSPATGEILIISSATLFGQDTKDVDLIVIGKLNDYSIRIKTRARTDKKQLANLQIIDIKEKLIEELELQKERNLKIYDFCFVIEIKGHCAEDIQLEGPTLLVRYNYKLHDVTTQSEKQKYALSKYFNDRIGVEPSVFNFIWLKNVGSYTIKDLLGNNPKILDKHNYLPNIFGLRWLFQLACVQLAPFTPMNNDINNVGRYCYFSSWYKKLEDDFYERINQIFDIFDNVKRGTGDLTRKKIEYITRNILKEQKYAQAIGEKLVIISGRAGTGKTIKLLNIAYDLATNRSARCLILTYNHALVSDIKRTLALAGVPDGVDTYSVNISTLHKFFYEVLIGFGVGVSKNENNRECIINYTDINTYLKLLNELYQYINEGAIEKKDLENLIKSRHEQIAWDYVLIDEAQDWYDIEKQLIYYIFGYENIIIADGQDQLIRQQKKCYWELGLKGCFHKTSEKKGLRQKSNLVNFINQVADRLNIVWDVEPKKDFYGGKIIIKIGDYTKELHDREFQKCKDNGNSAYEMMFLVPPSLVTKRKQSNNYGNEVEVREFSLIKDYTNKCINIWDGTKTDLRSSYPVVLESHKLFQYDSCRGLEGWTVICLELDEFMRYKFESFKEIKISGEQLLLETFEQKRDKFISLWTLIPLTRAIDTLIITIKNSESKIATILKDIHSDNLDNIEWIDESS